MDETERTQTANISKETRTITTDPTNIKIPNKGKLQNSTHKYEYLDESDQFFEKLNTETETRRNHNLISPVSLKFFLKNNNDDESTKLKIIIILVVVAAVVPGPNGSTSEFYQTLRKK